jgi:serine/threonine-protein kinase
MTDDGTTSRKTLLYGAIDPRLLHSIDGTTLTEVTELTTIPEPEVGQQIARYQVREVIGRGGMGEVLSVRDEQIGRFVAIKRLRLQNPPDTVVARFLREARIQGRLEHPAIVPVHELHHAPGEQPYFVMKQLAGMTLADVTPRLAMRDMRMAERFTRQRLLRAFSDVCLAIEFAHTRGVVHRDLKPANVMLGDFGEVYVLDWGIARVAGSEPQERHSFSDIDTADGTETVAGAILGTPGYIAPEQIRGDLDLDGRADVYSLGCILFELLALQPLHPRGQPALSSALIGIDARPSERAPQLDIPPELDAICARATATDRNDRFTTARELSDAVQRFLDGNRDVALRKELASAELAAARRALIEGDGAQQRSDAMRAAARALALDPTSAEPADLVGALMLQAPTETPAEVDRELEQLDLDALRNSARFGMLAAIAYIAFFPMLYWIGFRETWYLVAGPAVSLVIIAVELFVAPTNPFASGYIAMAGNFAMFAIFGWMVSPAVIGPGPAIIMITLLVAHRRLIHPWLLMALTVVATLAPWAVLIARGQFPVEAHGTMLGVLTAATDLHGMPTLIGLVVYLVAVAALATILSKSQHDEQREVRRRLQLQTWQLRQLVPRA